MYNYKNKSIKALLSILALSSLLITGCSTTPVEIKPVSSREITHITTLNPDVLAFLNNSEYEDGEVIADLNIKPSSNTQYNIAILNDVKMSDLITLDKNKAIPPFSLPRYTEISEPLTFPKEFAAVKPAFFNQYVDTKTYSRQNSRASVLKLSGFKHEIKKPFVAKKPVAKKSTPTVAKKTSLASGKKQFKTKSKK